MNHDTGTIFNTYVFKTSDEVSGRRTVRFSGGGSGWIDRPFDPVR
jgi:hypothetical protein